MNVFELCSIYFFSSRFISLQRTSGGLEPYFQALQAGFDEWIGLINPQFQTNTKDDDECFVVIYTDEPDQGKMIKYQEMIYYNISMIFLFYERC